MRARIKSKVTGKIGVIIGDAEYTSITDPRDMVIIQWEDGSAESVSCSNLIHMSPVIVSGFSSDGNEATGPYDASVCFIRSIRATGLEADHATGGVYVECDEHQRFGIVTELATKYNAVAVPVSHISR